MTRNINHIGRTTKSRKRLFTETAIAGVLLLTLLILICPFDLLEKYVSEPLMDPAGVLQVYPWVNFNAAETGQGHLPLWNPYTALGQPHLANIQSAVFFPLYWLWDILGATPGAYGAILILRLWLAGMFWFAFARLKLCSFPGALVTAAAYAGGGYCLWFMQLLDLNSQMLLPLCMLAFGRLMLRPALFAFLASALLTALALFGGHPEAAFITVFVAAIYALCAFAVESESGDSLVPRLVVLAGAGATGLLITMAVLLPFLNYLSRCWTMHGPGFGFFHLDPRGLFNLVLPGIHTLFTDMPKTIPVEQISKSAGDMFRLPYSATGVPGNLPGAGAVVCGLAVIGTIRAKKAGWRALFFTGLLAATLGLTFGLPLFRLIAFVPPFNVNSNFKFFFSEIHVCLAVLAGVGFDALGKRVGESVKFKVAPMLAVVAVVVIGWLLLWDSSVIGENWGYAIVGGVWKYVNLNYLLALPIYWDTALLILIVSALVLLRWMGRAVAYIALIPLALSLAMNAANIAPFVYLDAPPARMKQYLVPKLKTGMTEGERVVGADGYWPPNLLLIEEIKDVRSSDAMFYKPYVELINKINGLTPEESLAYFYPSYFMRPSRGSLTKPAALGLSAKYLLSREVWDPGDIVDQIVTRGSGIYGEAPPARSQFSFKDAQGYQFQTGLFLHPPAVVNYSFDTPSGTAASEGTLSFSPQIEHHGSDGVLFQVIEHNDESSRLAYSKFEGRSYFETILIGKDAMHIKTAPESSISISTLPGPYNNRVADWAGFAPLSWSAGPYQPPPTPIFDTARAGHFAYELPHLPWAHMEGTRETLHVTRRAGDAVEIDLNSSRKESLVVHEAWYPGWRVEIDGKPGRIEIPADKTSWRVSLPAGARKASFFFEPSDFRVGLFVSLAALLVILISIALKSKTGTHADER